LCSQRAARCTLSDPATSERMVPVAFSSEITEPRISLMEYRSVISS
jgi:hypothetical protein